MHIGRVLSMLVPLLAGGLALVAAPKLPAKQLKDVVNLGEHWDGPKRTFHDLKGRVVLFEVWGLN